MGEGGRGGGGVGGWGGGGVCWWVGVGGGWVDPLVPVRNFRSHALDHENPIVKAVGVGSRVRKGAASILWLGRRDDLICSGRRITPAEFDVPPERDHRGINSYAATGREIDDPHRS